MDLFYGSVPVKFVRAGGVPVREIRKGNRLIYAQALRFVDDGVFVVPAGVTKIAVDVVAAQGWSVKGGKGGRVQCDIQVVPGQVLYVKVGKQHAAYNDGTYDASDIRTDPDDLNSRLVVAGAGGARSVSQWLGWFDCAGGDGGGETGADGQGRGDSTNGIGAKGGTPETGGDGAYYSMYLSARTASKGTFGLGGAPSSERGGSGYGGAGWYGGGGGVDGYYYASSSAFGESGAAAAGGSSRADPSVCANVVHTQGYNTGDGYVEITVLEDENEF